MSCEGCDSVPDQNVRFICRFILAGTIISSLKLTNVLGRPAVVIHSKQSVSGLLINGQRSALHRLYYGNSPHNTALLHEYTSNNAIR